jgi:hypothetical protein
VERSGILYRGIHFPQKKNRLLKGTNFISLKCEIVQDCLVSSVSRIA